MASHSAPADPSEKAGRGFDRVWLAVILLTALLGLSVRLYDLDDPPLDFHSTRQLHAALIARGMYYQGLQDVPEWQRERAFSQWQAEGLIEPQIMQRLTAMTYRVIGSEQLWVARLFAVTFWMAGAVFLFLLARKISNLAGATAALAYFLVWPYAAVASRAFQPEPLLVAMIAAGLWAAVRWQNERGWRWASMAGLLCGLAIYVKVTAVFIIAPSLTGLILASMPFSRAWREKQVWLMAVLAVAPYAAYHVFGVFILGSLGQQFGLRFFPNLWIDPAFYVRWLGELNRVIGLEIFLAALLGSLLFAERAHWGMLVGFLTGYLIYGFTFAYHISTHDYYHLPLILVVSLGLALLVKGMLAGAVDRNPRAARWVLTVVLVFFILVKTWDVRVTLKRSDYRLEPRFWEQLGQEIGSDARVTGMLADYGYRLSYWGWANVTPWMSASDIRLRELAGETVDAQAALQETLAGSDYFIVTQMDEWASQPQVQDHLRANYPVTKETQEVIVFDLRAQDQVN